MKCARKECKGVPIDNNKGQPSACVGLAFGPIANRVMSVGLVLELLLSGKTQKSIKIFPEAP